MKLKNNGGNELTLTANAPYTFTTQVANLYNVTVSQQPTGQTCTVSSGIGTASSNITNATVTCTTSTYTIGGFVSGLGSGLSVVLQNNSANDLTINANGSFTFTNPVSYNGSYSVTVKTHPTNQSCSVTNGVGSNITGNITNVIVGCSNLPGTTVQSFTDLGDGTIRDNNTLLIWQKCSMGFNNDTNCTDDGNTTNNTATWENAGTYCTGLTNLPTANPRTWRLPSMDELVGIVDYTTTSGAMIKTLFFPSTVADYYWSSTTYAPDTTNAWVVDFMDGTATYYTKSTLGINVRCVSGP